MAYLDIVLHIDNNWIMGGGCVIAQLASLQRSHITEPQKSPSHLMKWRSQTKLGGPVHDRFDKATSPLSRSGAERRWGHNGAAFPLACVLPRRMFV